MMTMTTRRIAAAIHVAATTTSAVPGISSNEKIPPVHFWIHSSFRDHHGHQQVKPYGLEWGMSGESYMTFVPAATSSSSSSSRTTPPPPSSEEGGWNSPSSRRGLVEAYNRWAYSKQLEFKTVDDIENVTVVHNKKKKEDDSIHLRVEWKVGPTPNLEPFQYSTPNDMEAWIKNDPAAQSSQNPPAEVWVNGVYEGTLNGEMSLSPILLAIKNAQQGAGTTLCVKRYSSSSRGGLIRIEKYFRGMLRKHQVFEHIVDNLIAMEDPEILDSNTTMIGTATLPDWIMGGDLTSRLHIHEMENGDVQFLRPLYFDDVGTADRRIVLSQSRDPEKVAIVKKEIERLRYLATLQHPFGRKQAPKTANVATEQPQMVFDLEDSIAMSDVDRQHQQDDASVSSSTAVIPG